VVHGLCVTNATQLRRKTFVNGFALFSKEPSIFSTSKRNFGRHESGYGIQALLQIRLG
jgi:hypothetical protein